MSELGGGRAIQDRFIFAQDVEPDRQQEPTLWIDTSDPARTAYSYSAATGQFERLTVNDFEQIEGRDMSLLENRDMSLLENRDYGLLENAPVGTTTVEEKGGYIRIFTGDGNFQGGTRDVGYFVDGVRITFSNGQDEPQGPLEAEGYDEDGNLIFEASTNLDAESSETVVINFEPTYIAEIYGRSESMSDVTVIVEGNLPYIPEHSHDIE